jgi:hypothetical protein
MKKVFASHSELAHVWAQNNQEEGRASRMFFEHGKLFSYGRHFCIARILDSGVVVFGTHDYSSSTSKHQSEALHAVKHRRKVYCHDPDRTAADNREFTEKCIRFRLNEAKTSRRVLPATRVGHKLEAARLAKQFNEYLVELPEDERRFVKSFELEPLAVSPEELDVLRQYEEALQAKREAMWERQREARALVEEWRACVYNHSLHAVPTMLRVSKDSQSIETSKGANIPISAARRLWPLIENCRSVGTALVDREMPLGHYTLTEIKANGDITVGCHDIAYSEIERIAKAMGLLSETTV